MEFKIIELGYFIDQIRGVKKQMRGYVTGIVCDYLGYKLYEVELQDYGYYQLWEWQIQEI